MGLFDKKYCDICGEKIGLLGNRKLDDGNLCKDCARKLSPFFTGRRRATVESIREHLQYREENERELSTFHPTRVLGNETKIYLDEAAGRFVVSGMTDWRSANPDLISLSQVMNVDVAIEEHREELYQKTEDGKRESYNPPRYKVEYEFTMRLQVDSPWFQEISFELTQDRPDSPYTDQYRYYERQGNEICMALRGEDRATPLGGVNRMGAQDGFSAQGNAPGATVNQGGAQSIGSAAGAAVPMGAGAMWSCQCGATNQGNFCSSCGSPKPAPKRVQCNRCGWIPDAAQPVPRFCPQCGDPFNEADFR